MKGINDIVSLAEGGTIPVDLFAFHLSYDEFTYPNSYDIRNVTLLYNGNISQAFWKTSNDNVLRQYNYNYDKLNRLTDASYSKTGISNTNSYGESLTYDKNGNIQSLQRSGEYDDLNYDMSIDNLSYVYDENNRNQLTTVFDGTNNPKGFKDDTDGLDINSDGVDYTYDANGNMISDTNKEISGIQYNHLNLPTTISFNGSINSGSITYLYNALGQKVRKRVESIDGDVSTDYLNGFQYKNGELQFFPHAEGYVNNTVVDGNNNYNYVFNYTDHLGNVRLSYTNSVNGLEILEENNYYPFGLKHANYNMDQINYEEMMSGGTIGMVPVESIPYKYKYNGKELQDELGLNWYDYGARNYDAAIGRWMNIDPLAEQYESWSGYNYVLNNPIVHVDPDGRSVDNEYNHNVTTGKTELVSKKGGDKTDYINVYVGDKKPSKIYSETVAVKKTTVNIQSPISERGSLLTVRLPGEIRTTNTNPISGAMEDPSAGLMADYIGGKIVGAAISAVWNKAASFFATEAAETAASTGGRLGNEATRTQIGGVASELETRGYTITGGGGRAPEEYLRPLTGGRKGGSYLDLTATHPEYGTLRINTVDVTSRGLPTVRESTNAARIRTQIPRGEHLLLIPKI